MRKQTIWIIFITTILFIGINIFLLFKFDKEVTKTKSTKQLAFVHTSRMQTLHKTAGVVAPTDELQVFYDPKIGSLDKILVKEGEVVAVGDSLLVYSDTDLEGSRKHFEGLIDQAEAEILMLEDTIDELRGLKTTVEAFSPSDKEKEEEVEQVQEEKAARVDVEIASNHHQIQQVEAKIDGYEAQLEAISNNEDQLTVTSSVNGVVKEIDQSKNGPLITVYETPYVVKGELTETKTQQILEGQKAFFTSKVYPGQKFNGTIENLSKIPVNKPELNKPSFYPFSVKVEDAPEPLQPGFHVDVAIVTAEKEDAVVVPKMAVFSESHNKYVFVIKNGKVEKRKVKLGIKEQTKVEVVKGVHAGDIIITEHLKQLRDGNAVVKAIEFSNLSKKAIKELPKRKIFRLITEGLFK